MFKVLDLSSYVTSVRGKEKGTRVEGAGELSDPIKEYIIQRGLPNIRVCSVTMRKSLSFFILSLKKKAKKIKSFYAI